MLALDRFDVFRRAILAGSHAAVSKVVQLETDGLEAGFWCGTLFKDTLATPRTVSAYHIRLANPSGSLWRRLLCWNIPAQFKTGDTPCPQRRLLSKVVTSSGAANLTAR